MEDNWALGGREKWWRVSSEELNNFFSSPDIVLVINSRRPIWADLCSTYGERRDVYRVWWRNLRTKDYLEDLGIDSKIILKCILKNRMWAWAGSIWLRVRADGVLSRTW